MSVILSSSVTMPFILSYFATHLSPGQSCWLPSFFLKRKLNNERKLMILFFAAEGRENMKLEASISSDLHSPLHPPPFLPPPSLNPPFPLSLALALFSKLLFLRSRCTSFYCNGNQMKAAYSSRWRGSRFFEDVVPCSRSPRSFSGGEPRDSCARGVDTSHRAMREIQCGG